MKVIAQYGTATVVSHAMVVALHGLAHVKIPVPLSLPQNLFVSSVIVFAPIAAMILLWTPFQLAGSWLLLSSMAGALLFGLYHHFIAFSPDQSLRFRLPVGALFSRSLHYFCSSPKD